MDIPKLRVIFQYYDQYLGEKGIEPLKTHLRINDCPLRHVRWMCQTVLKEYLPNKRVQKSARWLGFVQGILFMTGTFSVSELCGHVLTNGSEGDDFLTKEYSNGDR